MATRPPKRRSRRATGTPRPDLAATRALRALERRVAQLRHHEARAAVLERLVAERDAMLARLGAGRAVPEQPGGPSVPHPAP